MYCCSSTVSDAADAMSIFAAFVVALLLSDAAQCQQDCAYPTDEDLAEIIHSAITAGVPFPPVDIYVLNTTALCLSHSLERDRYRHASVLTEYSCNGLSTCSNLTVVEQFVIHCEESVWNSPANATNVSMLPLGNFSTTQREDCTSCITSDMGEMTGVIVDPVTNCVG